jgi:hypothetical protein
MHRVSLKKQRKSYTIDQKLDILLQYDADNKVGFRTLSRQTGIAESIIRGWNKQRDKLFALRNNPSVKSRLCRRLIGGGRKPAFSELEETVHAWIVDRNEKGIRVKDRYIQKKAQNERDKMLNIYGDESSDSEDDSNAEMMTKLADFKASNSWLENFKNRFNLVSRRHTTTRSLPENFAETAKSFIFEIQKIIKDHKIKDCNIINMDQVPRYFESEPNSTITTKGSKQVLLKKGSQTHKKFTVTPTICANGQMLKPHFLFAKLKNKPLVADGCVVEVNEKTSMWNEMNFRRYMKDFILSRPQTQLSKEWVLLLIDSYPVHKKVSELSRDFYERNKVIVKLIPPGFTGLLQPLDVSSNRSLQAFFSSKFDEYLNSAVNSTVSKYRTKQGGIKTPSYLDVTSWIMEWKSSRSAADISKAFELCGLVHPDNFCIDKLHEPLKKCFAEDFDEDIWINDFGNSVVEKELNFFDQDIITDWNFTPVTDKKFYKSLYDLARSEGETMDFVSWLNMLIESMEDFIKNDSYLMESMDEDDFKELKNGEMSSSNIELIAAAEVLMWEIQIHELNSSCNEESVMVFRPQNIIQTVYLARNEEFVAFKLL